MKNLLIILAGKTLAADLQSTLNQYDPTPDPTALINSLLNRIPVFLGAFAIIALLIAGVTYALAFGDASKQAQAKKNITWTAIGIIAASSVMLLIKLVVWFVRPGVWS